MTNNQKKKFAIYLTSLVLFTVPSIGLANQAGKEVDQAAKKHIEYTRMPKSQKVEKDSELFLLMQKNFTQLKKDYQEMIVDVNDLVKNGQPVKSMQGWNLEKKSDYYEINVPCRKRPELVPLGAVKRYFYKELSNGQKTEGLTFRLNFYDESVSFTTSYGAELFFLQRVLIGHYFILNENRTYRVHFDEKGKFRRAEIKKSRYLKEEKEPEYELYFTEQNELDIIKNKLMNHLIKQSYIARTTEINKTENISNRSVSKTDYDITFGKDRTISRFFRKSTEEEITFHSNGKVKSYSVSLPDNKSFEAKWDEQGRLVEE